MIVGIAGAGNIVPSFLLASKDVDGIQVKAICCTANGVKRAQELCASYNIDNLYTDYDKMLTDEEIDTVYVAVPNDLHYLFTKKALEANKNVIVEKPFVTSKNQALELKHLAEDNGLFLFEAITTQYSPDYLKLKETIPDIGDIKIVTINYSQYSSRYDRFKRGEILPAFDPKKAGGALMDLGVYNVHFIYGLFGFPQSINYYPNIQKEIDTSGILVLTYKEMKCVCVAAKDCKASSTITIQGDKGYIYSDASSNVFDHFYLQMNDGLKESYALYDRDIETRMFYELDAFETMIKTKDYSTMRNRLNHTIDVVSILEEARFSSGLTF